MGQVQTDAAGEVTTITVRQGTTLGPIAFHIEVDGVRQSLAGLDVRLQVRRRLGDPVPTYSGDTRVAGSGLVKVGDEVQLLISAVVTETWSSGVWDAESYDVLDPSAVRPFGGGLLVMTRAVTR